jgi:hypothetical protein
MLVGFQLSHNGILSSRETLIPLGSIRFHDSYPRALDFVTRNLKSTHFIRLLPETLESKLIEEIQWRGFWDSIRDFHILICIQSF